MGQHPDNGRVDLRSMFQAAQWKLQASLAAGRWIDHGTSAGTANEREWIHTLNRYLPARYHAASVFVIDAAGRRSRQIDIAVFDRLNYPVLFPDAGAAHIPVEGVRAVFEVKVTVTSEQIADAAEKIASVRRLLSTSPLTHRQHITGGILGLRSTLETFKSTVSETLKRHKGSSVLDLGCVLDGGGAWDAAAPMAASWSRQEDALMFFVLRLLSRLRQPEEPAMLDALKYMKDVPAA